MKNLDEYYSSLKDQTNNQLGLYLFCCSIGVVWTVYVLFFNSRLIGSIATFFLNLYLKRYSKNVWIKIRSLSISFLSGKIMFRGVHYVTIDYMLYVQDGYITFAYWKPQFVLEKVKKGASGAKNDKTESINLVNTSKPGKPPKFYIKKRTARLNICLCNFQLHYYNSWKAPSVVKQQQTDDKTTAAGGSSSKTNFLHSNSLFNFISSNFNISALYQNGNNPLGHDDDGATSSTTVSATANATTDYNFTEDLMQLFSVVNIKLQKGKVFAGNSTLPSTLVMRLSNAKMELVTEKSQSKVDDYCFILRGDLNKLEFSLIQNKKFQGVDQYQINTEKKLENRILIFRCVSSDFEYVQDIPSILTFDRRYLKKNETGELIQNEKEPQWSLTLNCNKHTILNYGPWYDRQREALWKFFFPPNYEKLEPQPEPTLNERRQTSKFDFSIRFKDPNTEVNLLFTSNMSEFPQINQEKNFVANERKIAIKCRSESYLDVSIPWLTKQYGYKTTIVGEFNQVRSNTSLAFKEFLNADKVRLDVDVNYPLVWNDQQFWNINLDIYRGSIFFVFYYKYFFQDLINDFSTRTMGDVRRFVPFLYTIKLNAHEAEVLLPCNQHNWIDTTVLENNSIFALQLTKAFIQLNIPFIDFLPEKTNVTLDVQIGEACGRFIVPPTNNNLVLLNVIKKNINYVTFQNGKKLEFNSRYWSQFNTNTPGEDATDSKTAGNREGSNDTKASSQSKANKKSSSRQSNKQLKSSLNSKSGGSGTTGQTKAQNNVRFSPNVGFSTTTSSNGSDHLEKNWVECWQAKSASVKLDFEYHPCPVLDWNNDKLPTVSYLKSLNSPNFDCEIFNTDTIFLDIELGPSVIMLYGTFLKRLWYIKEAYFSWDQFYSEMNKNFDQLLNMQQQQHASSPPTSNGTATPPTSPVSRPYQDSPVMLLASNQKDPRNFRPFAVKLSLAIHNINGHLALDLTEGVGNVPLPIGFTDRIALELHKQYKETKLQLFVDPVNVFIEDLMPRQYDRNLQQGHLCLSSVSVRGHAMFSDEGRLKTDTLEYAWLLEILLGDVTGYATPIQAEQLLHGLEAFFTTILENDYQLQPVYTNRADPASPYKYEVTRFSLDKVDLYLVESGTALNINLNPVRLSLCNSHTNDFASCLSAIIGDIGVKLFVNEASRADIEAHSYVYTREKVKKSSKPKDETNKKSPSKHTEKLNSVSNAASLTSLSSTTPSLSSISSLNSSIYSSRKSLASQNTLVEKDNQGVGSNSSTLTMKKKPKEFDSNDFNYWFECSSISSGVIKFDLTLDKGNPEEQIKFLKLHDARDKNLYFLWRQESATWHSLPKQYSTDSKASVSGGTASSSHRCGCYGGGCYYYSVFPDAETFEFFNLDKSISRTNKLFGESLFYPGVHILDSQPMMRNKYPRERYTYEAQLVTESDLAQSTSPSISLQPKQIRKMSTQSKGFQRSISSISEVLYNEDDYFTASDVSEDDDEDIDSEEEENTHETTWLRKNQSSVKSNAFSGSKQSYYSVINGQTPDEDKNRTLTHQQSKESQRFMEANAASNETPDARMDLNFDIRRPILDSSLPKYCYLKHLSRAYVENWNKRCSYPCYEDSSNKNIKFHYRQKGISFVNATKMTQSSSGASNQNTTSFNFNFTKSGENNGDDSTNNTEIIVKCRINLKLSTLDCYITPLLLTGLSRFTNSLKLYKINPNSLITELQAKAQAHCAANSFIEAISKTQVSLRIPQIRLFSLQCGLAEGDKISNAFTNTLENPDQFITLSLFTICINSIQTQLIDSPKRTSALFMIDQIVTQFSRLYDEKNFGSVQKQTPLIQQHLSKSGKNEKLKVSYIYSDDSLKNLTIIPTLKSLLMYECAFDSISIKALKNGSSTASTGDSVNQRLSLCDFDIAKIWFSFPEPPQSPKGKRKIPFSRFDWNLLSSVSPAVISWLCASKHTIKPIKEFLESRAKRYLEIVAALVTGSLKNREQLEQEINSRIEFYNNKEMFKSKSESRFSRKSNLHKKANQSDTVANFMQIYLTKSSLELYKDSNCRLVNLMRNYLLYFRDDFEADLNSSYMPDSKLLKKGINEVLNSWSNFILTQPATGSSFSNSVNSDTTNPEEFKFFTEIRENKFDEEQINDIEAFVATSGVSSTAQKSDSDSNDLLVSVNDRNLITTQLVGNQSAQMVKSRSKSSSLDKINLVQPRMTTESSNKPIDETAFHSGHVGPKLRQTNKIFRPILNVIGIDAPSGTLIDNLFKEFGPLLQGKLNIKSVHINILSSENSRASINSKLAVDKVVTTILSFDDLLFNINVRQVMPSVEAAPNLPPADLNSNPLSMSNPLYKSDAKPSAFISFSSKYLTKIDAGIHINNLTQEINMPLLRLVHQFYSIIADAIEYDKEHNKQIANQSFTELSDSIKELRINAVNNQPYNRMTSYHASASSPILPSSHQPTSNATGTSGVQSVLHHKDCWRFMAGMLELREFIPEPKYVEKNELDRKNSQKNHQKFVHITKDALSRESSQLSFFGWINVKRAHSKAGLGTLALSGEMNNIQTTLLFGRKIIGTSNNARLQYEGSVNVRMDSTTGVLLENDTKQNVVQISVKKSHMFSCLKNFQVNNTLASFVHVGEIHIDVPLRPMIVHGVVYRESKEIEQNILPELKNFSIFENMDVNNPNAGGGAGGGANASSGGDSNTDSKQKQEDKQSNQTNDKFGKSTDNVDFERQQQNTLNRSRAENRASKKPPQASNFLTSAKNAQQSKFTFQLKAKFDGCEISAKLLENPSLRAAYTIKGIYCQSYLTDHNSKTVCTLNSHYLSFQCDDDPQVVFQLPSISLTANHQNQTQHSTSIELDVKISPLHRELNAEVIAQLVFVTKVFLKEINIILLAVYNLDQSNSQSAIQSSPDSKTKPKQAQPQPQPNRTVASKPSSHVILFDVKLELGQISLTGITPTNTALTVCSGEKSSFTISNLTQSKTHIESKCLISVELKTLQPVAASAAGLDTSSPSSGNTTTNMNHSNESDQQNNWYQLAYFNTRFHLRNFGSTESHRESIVISVEKPRFYLQPGAVDSAILFWLNYKNTYEFWIEQRQQFSNLLLNETFPLNLGRGGEKILRNNQQQSSNSNKKISADSPFLLIKLSVTGLGVALPLSNIMTKDIATTNVDCLVITLNETVIYACSSGCIVSKGQFKNFCLRFSENFNLSSSEWTPPQLNLSPEQQYYYASKSSSANNGRCLMNAWVVPSGNYEVCSSTIEKPTLLKPSPVWILSVKWKMDGIEVNLDTTIGKWLTKFADTVTRLADTQNRNTDNTTTNEQDAEIRRLKKEMNFYMERGDASKVNFIQSRLDILTLASYPERAKQIFVKNLRRKSSLATSLKTRNNLRGQLGFNNPTPSSIMSTPSKHEAPTVGTPLGRIPNSKSEDQHQQLFNLQQQKNTDPEFQENLIRRQSATSAIRRHSLSNDDLIHSGSGNSFVQRESALIEEGNNDQDPGTPSTPSRPLQTPTGSHSSSSHPNQQQPTAHAHTSAPAIDFKLNVKIEIKSGKCVLHANKTSPNAQTMNGMSSTGGGQPAYQHRQSQAFPNTFSEYYQQQRAGQTGPPVLSPMMEQEMRITNFAFPAIGVKTFYESTHKKVDQHNNRLSKRANLYAMIKLESFVMPQFTMSRDLFVNSSRDMCISPALLDFLEQTMEPFDLIKAAFVESNHVNKMEGPRPVYNGKHAKKRSLPDIETERINQPAATQPQLVTSTTTTTVTSAAAYFPIDVVVFISMLPSSIRFTCQPQSTMECLLKLPSVEMVFSTNRLDEQAQSKLATLLNSDRFHDDMKYHPPQDLRSSVGAAPSTSNEGGLSLTCSMTDFSLKFYNRLGMRNNFDQRFFYTEQLYYTEDKDSLSVRVAYIKVNISRFRRVNSQLALTNTISTSGSTSTFSNSGAHSPTLSESDNMSVHSNDVKLSILADVGQSSFIYDMRNIKEVFVFPKIWYRRSLARRVFLGEETSHNNNINTTNNTTSNASPNLNSSRSTQFQSSQENVKSGVRSGLSSAGSRFSDGKMRRRSKKVSSRDSNKLTVLRPPNGRSHFSDDDDGAGIGEDLEEYDSHASLDELSRPKTLDIVSTHSSESVFSPNVNWRTMVLVSVNLAGFDIKMNIGSVLGNVLLLTKNARATSKISISRFGPKEMKFNFSLDKSKLITDGGSNSCSLRIQDITAAIEINDKDKITKCPSHKLEFCMFAAECRVETAYNTNSPILAFRMSSLNLKLNDSWDPLMAGFQLTNLSPDKIPEALIELNVAWDQFHLMITRSTTPDLLILYYKLIDFFEKQFSEGKDYIKECELDLFYEMKVKQQFVEKKETLVKKSFNANGGNIHLKGNNFTLITFHGNTFKAMKWAVFSMNEPSMEFASQSQFSEDGELTLHNQQSLCFYLGRNERKRDMASIYQVSRDSTSIFTKFQTINEWFEYAHSSIDAAGLRDFPRFAGDDPLLLSTVVKKGKYQADQTKWEEIFHLPSLQVFCMSTQSDNKVRFEFKTDFHDHIQLTLRTEHFGFLHELITSYVKETDMTRSKEPNIPDSKKDERVYECAHWELEPTLRLMPRFGNQVEPLGVDALLKSLGLMQARSTVPKWLQRGLFDNLNEIMHKLIKSYVKILSDGVANQATNATASDRE